jgi:cytochrome c553
VFQPNHHFSVSETVISARRLAIAAVRSSIDAVIFTGLVFLTGTGSSLAEASDPPSAADIEFFESKIRPLLISRCIDCHGPDDAQSDLRLDSLSGMLAGGISGPVVVPGNADESMIVAAIGYRDEALQMPPDEKLPDAEIALLKDWITRGAPHPEVGGEAVGSPRRGAIDLEQARQFWAFKPIVRPTVPAVQAADWVRDPIDAFVLADLESKGLTPAPGADRRTLIRRVTFGLTGLPPTPEEIADFLADDSPNAYEKVVDRLLDSKRYGEHWGRHWLDIARYADSNGLDENVAHGNAWRYRDYVIRSFNADKPLDRFIVEQIAGDLLVRQDRLAAKEKGRQANDTAETAPGAVTPESPLVAVTPEEADRLIATGFLALGPKVLAEADQTKMRMDIIDEQIDTIGRSLLGLTLGCARCHDHKFDPISTADYYALAGILSSTRTMESLATVAKWNENSIASGDDLAIRAEHEQKIARQKESIAAVVEAAKAEVSTVATGDGAAAVEAAPGTEPPAAEAADPESAFSEAAREKLKQMREELAAMEASLPALPTAMGVRDEDAIADVRIHVRGSHLTLGKSVPRGIPEVLAETRSLLIGDASSGRLELAQWLVAPENPLTPRVMANRLWRWHFGRGLVGTTDNFGLLGEKPTHPELLDWLASQWHAEGWSLKAMHRRLVLSNTYQMSSEAVPQNVAIDPENGSYWRSDIRRLQAESIRDAVLAASGQLDDSMGGSMLHVGNYEFIFNHTSKDETSYKTARRSVYLPVIRNNLYDAFSLFDYTTADVTNGDRQTSTVAPQALFMLNSELLLESAEAFAARLRREIPDDEPARLNRLFELGLGRLPTEDESRRLLRFVSDFKAAEPGDAEPGEQTTGKGDAAWVAVCQSVLACNEFLYVR